MMESFTIGQPGFDTDVICEDEYVSPIHCRVILTDEGHVLVEDLFSQFGTHVVCPFGIVTVVPLGEALQIRPGDTLVVGLRAGLAWVPRPCRTCGALADWNPYRREWVHCYNPFTDHQAQ